MARYVDGYILPVPKNKLDVYRRIAQKAGRIWREHGALEYRECAGEDLNVAWGKTFLRLANAKPGETVVFSYIVFKSRAHRDQVNKRVMKDMNEMGGPPKDMPFDPKRMVYGGFKTLVE